MQIKYVLHGINFEWDGKKAATNLRKHNVSFELACEAFFDPFVFYIEDEILDGELRETIVGLTTGWHLLYVVYMLRDDMIRIVSARSVTNAERDLYENQ
jgi:uncharacterized DUF497 family protein